MKRRTATQLSELHEGDRYIVKHKPGIYQLMKKEGKNIEVNEIENDTPIHKYNIKGNAKQNVIFLRHTKPEPGEECFIEDLSPQDVFYKADDEGKTAYVLLGKMTQLQDMYGFKKQIDDNAESSQTYMAHKYSSIILIQRADKKECKS